MKAFVFPGLNEIAGSDGRVLQVANFKAIGDIAKSLLKKVCKEIKLRKTKKMFAVSQNFVYE